MCTLQSTLQSTMHENLTESGSTSTPQDHECSGDDADEASHDSAGTDNSTAKKRVRQKRDVLQIRLEGDTRHLFEALVDHPDARASINNRFRRRKPQRPELVLALLKQTGWCRLQDDGTCDYSSLHDPSACTSSVLAGEVEQLEQQLVRCWQREQLIAQQKQQIAQEWADLEAAKLAAVERAAMSIQQLRELRRTEAQQAELELERQRATAAEAAAAKAERELDKVKRTLEESQVTIQRQADGLKSAPARGAAQHAAREAERQQLQRLECENAALREAAVLAGTAAEEQQCILRSEQMRRGHAVTQLESLRIKLSQVEAAQSNTSLRNLERREAERVKELADARTTVAELRAELELLRATQPAGRGERRSFHQLDNTLVPIRTSSERDDAPFDARAIEFQRRLVDEGNLSFEGAATANALVLGMHLGLPSADRLVCSKSFQNAFHRGGLLDNEREAEANRACPALWAFASDSQKGIQMMLYFKFNYTSFQPEAHPLAASDLFRDESHENVADIDVKALMRMGLNPARLISVLTDGTEHAVLEGNGVIDAMRSKAQALPDATRLDREHKALREFCCIHGFALEEKCGMEAAFPKEYLVDGLRLLWELVASPETGRTKYYRTIWVCECKLPAHLYDDILAHMSEPTSSKWQVMYDICKKLLPLLEPHGNLLVPAARRCMLEIFLDRCRELNCGTTDDSRAQRVVHPHTEKVKLLSGALADLHLIGAIYLTVDAWEQCYSDFMKFCKSPARYGGFKQPFLRHMIAVEACRMTLWYEQARAKPASHLPRCFKFINAPRRREHLEQMTEGKRKDLEKRAAAFLQVAQERHLKWNGTTWTRPRHLLGVLCDEDRRQWFAQELLVLLGKEEELGAALSAAAPRGRRIAASARAMPADGVDRMLLVHLRARHEDGSLAAELACWPNNFSNRQQNIDELILLATAAPRQTEVDPVLSMEETPSLCRQFIGMLFTGPVHNLLIESLVSRKSEIERIHRNVSAETLEHRWLYRCRQAAAREARLAATLRSTSDGARRVASVARAAAGKSLTGSSNRNRSQQLLLCCQTQVYADGLSTKRLLSRGQDSIAKKRRVAHQEYLNARASVAEAHVASQARSWAEPRRTKPLTATGCASLVPKAPAPFTTGAKGRGNFFKDKGVIQEGKKALKARAKASAVAKIVCGRTKPLNRRTERSAAAKPAGVVPGQRVNKSDLPSGTLPMRGRPQRTAAANAAARLHADDDADEDTDGSGSEEEGEESDVEGDDEEMDGGGEGDEAAADEAPTAACDPVDDAAEGELEERAALQERYAHVRRNVKLWEDRFVSEFGRKPSGSDRPFHILAEREEYFTLKARLGLA